jgi:hypothetical protein
MKEHPGKEHPGKAQIIYLDNQGNACDKEQAVEARIIETLPDGSRRETYGFINKLE